MEQVFTTHSHNLVVDADSHLPIFSDDGQMVLLNRVEDDSLNYFPLEAVEEVFGKISTASRYNIQIAETADDFQNLPSTSKDNIERRITWTHKDIVKLIQIYKEHASLFKSQTIRHEKIWKMMAQSMPGFSSEQVKNKFKYLKGRYIKKMENMSDKASGEEKFVFDYFDEFNEIFGKEPNIKPVSIASSLKKRKLNEDETPDLNNEASNTSTEIKENKNSKENMHPDSVMETPKKKEKSLASKVTEVLLGLREDLRKSGKGGTKKVIKEKRKQLMHLKIIFLF